MTRVTNQVSLGYVEHSSVTGASWSFVAKGTTSGAGNAGGTTLVDASSPSGSADTYNGRYWVHILSGDNKGERKRIIDDDGSGSLTVEVGAFTNQVASAVDYEIWKSPEPVIVVDSSGAATDIVDAVRAEGNDYWNGYYVVPITGNRRGEIQQITDFTQATGTFVVDDFTGVLAAGDVCLIRKFVETTITPDNLPTEWAYHPRPGNRQNMSVADGVVGARGGEVSFNTHIYGSGSLAAADAAANKSVLHGLLRAAQLEISPGTSATVGAGSSTTAIKIATGKWENLTIGQCVEYQGNVRRITAQTDGAGAVDTITVSPALPYAPTSGDVLHGMYCYQKSTDADGMQPVTIEVEFDGVRTTMTGCKGNVELVDGPILELSWTFSVDHWIREIEAAPYNPGAAYTTQPAILGTDKLAWLDTTGTDIKGFTATPGTTVVARNVSGTSGPNGRNGFYLSNYNCGGTFREIMDSSGDLTQDLRWTARTAKAVLVVYGSHANAMAISMPVARMIEAPNPGDGDGLMEAPNVLQAQDAGVTSDPDDTIVKVPDWSLCLT